MDALRKKRKRRKGRAMNMTPEQFLDALASAIEQAFAKALPPLVRQIEELQRANAELALHQERTSDRPAIH